MKKAFVIGWPVSHSLSPVLHGYWLDQAGLDASYQAVPVAKEDLANFLQTFPDQEFVGGNITIPHKEAALDFIPRIDETARRIGAVNTVWLEKGNLYGTNTDGYGFAANLDEHAPRWRQCPAAIVLGAGGAARAVVDALAGAGISRIAIVNRTVERAESLAASFSPACSAHGFPELTELLGEAGILVNTTAAGMTGEGELPVQSLSTMQSDAIVTDIVYTPLETPLLSLAKKAGLQTVDGLGMLLHQAVPGFEKWFGIRPAVTPDLRDRVLSAKQKMDNRS